MTKKWNKPGQHFCSLWSAEKGDTGAVDDCVENDAGEFWAGTGEYGSQVNYCPVCGAKAPVQVPADKWSTQ